MNSRLRLFVAMPLAAASLFGLEAAAGEAPESKVNQGSVTWTSAPSEEVVESNVNSGARVARDPQTGKLRAPLPGELQDVHGQGTKSEVVQTAKGTFLVVGDDLMSDVVATRHSDGSVHSGCEQHAKLDATSSTAHEEK